MARAVGPGVENPFQFGRELGADELVDRAAEVALVTRTIRSRGRLFFIGPRRYGKTSVLAAAEERLSKAGVVVLRYNAEAYESLAGLAQALLTGAARRLGGPADKAAGRVRRLFSRLKPEVTYDFDDRRVSVTLGRQGPERAEVPVLADVLDGIDRLAGERRRVVGIIIDEFQQVVAAGGEAAERQIRSAVQRHRHVAYIFSGSRTRLLADMTGDPSRAFWKLGDRYFLGPIPRDDFRAALRRGFGRGGFKAQPDAIERILDRSEDVPYNVQRLASACWERLRAAPAAGLTADMVDATLDWLVEGENPAYMQLWQSLTRTQKMAVKAVIEAGGKGLMGRATLQQYGMAASSMQRALQALDARGVVREEDTASGSRFRLEDPFFAAWLALIQRDAP